MSKVGNLVMSAQTFAQEHYNVSESEFLSKAKEVLGSGTEQYKAAVDAFNDIRFEMSEYYALEQDAYDLIHEIDEDGIPYTIFRS